MRQKKLYKELVQKDFDALERERSNSTKKKNILKIFENINQYLLVCIFTMESC